MGIEVATAVEGRRHMRDLLVEGRPVSHVVVHDRATWTQGVQVRMGGLGGVRTDAEHRMKGNSRRLLDDTVRYMTDLGQDVAVLFGIQDFYSKFGFAPCLVDSTVRVATRDAESAAAMALLGRARPARPDDYPFILDLYEEANRHRAGPVVREAQHFRGFHWGTLNLGSAAAFVLDGPGDERLAYAAYLDRSTEVRVVEVEAASRRAFPGLLRKLSHMAIERRCAYVELQMPPDHSFAGFLKRCGCRVEAAYPRMGGGMMRVLNQDSLLAKLAPALTSRLAQSRFQGARILLQVETDLGSSRLCLGPEGGHDLPVTVSLCQSALMQLIMGYRDAADVLEDPHAQSEGEAEAVLDVLFGRQFPYVWQADRF